MQRVLVLCLLSLAGCATGRASNLRVMYRAGDPVLGAPVGTPIISGKVLAWGETEAQLRATFPDVALQAQSNWLVAALKVEGQPANVYFTLENGGLSEVGVVFANGADVRRTYQAVRPVLDAELGEPQESEDEKGTALSEARTRTTLLALAEMSNGIATLFGDDFDELEAQRANNEEMMALAQADLAQAEQLPDSMHARWTGPGGTLTLRGEDFPEPTVELVYQRPQQGAVSAR